MASRPGLFTDWDLNLTDVSNPSGAEVTDGYAQNDLPTRQVLNRLFSLYGLWTRWFDQTIGGGQLGIESWENNQILFGLMTFPAEFSGTPPVWSGTHSTTLPANWFYGGAIISKTRVGPIGSPLRSGGSALTNLRDYYVDLGIDGVWDFNDVANGGGAPVLAADHIRVFQFVTNGAALITSGTFYGNYYLENGVPIRFDAGAIIDGLNGLSVDETSNRSVLIHDGQSQFPGSYNDPFGSSAKSIMWGDSTSVPAGIDSPTHWTALMVNCRWSGSAWARLTGSEDAYLILLTEGGLYVLQHAAADANTWADTLTATTWIRLAKFGHGGSFGTMWSGTSLSGPVNFDDDIFTPASVSADDFIADTQVSTPLSIAGRVRVSNVVSETIGSNLNNYNPAGIDDAGILRINPDSGPYNITGIIAQTAGTELTIINSGSAESLTIMVEDGSSSAANRFADRGAGDVVVTWGGAAKLWYDGPPVSRWRITAVAL